VLIANTNLVEVLDNSDLTVAVLQMISNVVLFHVCRHIFLHFYVVFLSELERALRYINTHFKQMLSRAHFPTVNVISY